MFNHPLFTEIVHLKDAIFGKPGSREGIGKWMKQEGPSEAGYLEWWTEAFAHLFL